jgi:hypothetical protein
MCFFVQILLADLPEHPIPPWWIKVGPGAKGAEQDVAQHLPGRLVCWRRARSNEIYPDGAF